MSRTSPAATLFVRTTSTEQPMDNESNTADGPAIADDCAIADRITPNFQAYQAPRGHCDYLVQPGLSQTQRLIQENISLAESYPDELRSIRESARKQLLQDARRYTSAYRDVSFASPAQPGSQSIVMAGHQPTLFHPGVWFKNFALNRVGELSDSIAINLVVDSDVAGVSSIRVPRLDGASGEFGFSAVPYDRRGGGVPYEQALIEDRETFDAFDRNVANTLTGIVDDPMVTTMWQFAREAINRCGYAGCALAQARHRQEADLDLQTLEIPQSVVCRGEAFATFVMGILRDLPRFHDCYNASAQFYRQAHGIRSNAHPVPDLGRDGDWYQAPLWVYGNQSPKRRGVWVRLSASGSVMEISDRDKRYRKIEAANLDSADEAFAALASPEFKIRSRALVTTMYARMVLSDLFLHGIGGGKYDQLGDLISRAFWGVRPQHFMVMSATVLLPGHQQHPIGRIDDAIARLDRKCRDIEYQPERFADAGNLPADLIDEKRSMLASVPPKGQRRQWHRRITRLNQSMSNQLQTMRSELIAQLAELQSQRRVAAHWNSREHSFCIYPLDYLTQAYRGMLETPRHA
ncbi:MAG: hypothetical protein KDB00_13285 [Planctomycetales bacterium]|nr:hypothetical protein [Planctomycetales bacterium]